MNRLPKATKSEPSNLKKYLYLANIGLYSLAVYLIIFTAHAIMRWWQEDLRYALNYAAFIWLPIGLLLLNPLIWRRVYPTISLEIVGIGLLLLNLVLMTFLKPDYRVMDQLGWGVVTLISVMFTLYAWYRAKPWHKVGSAQRSFHAYDARFTNQRQANE